MSIRSAHHGSWAESVHPWRAGIACLMSVVSFACLLAAIGWPGPARPDVGDERARAEVVSVRESTSVSGGDGQPLVIDHNYYPTVRFMLADGREVEAESRCSLNDRPGVGDTIDVFYELTRPDAPCIDGGNRPAERRLGTIVLVAASLLATAAAVGLFVWALRE